MVVLGPDVPVLGMSSSSSFTSTNLTRVVSSLLTVVSLPVLPALDDFLLMEMFVVPSVTVLMSFLVLGLVTMILQW